jgi:hypothetical protein
MTRAPASPSNIVLITAVEDYTIVYSKINSKPIQKRETVKKICRSHLRAKPQNNKRP